MARKKDPQPAIDSHRPWAECFLLCDFARSENGKLYIVGGGWNHIVAQQFPLEYESYLAIKIDLPWESVAGSATVRVELLDKSGKMLGDPVLEGNIQDEQPDSIGPAEDAPEQGRLVATLLLATGVRMTLTTPGRFILRLLVNDEMIAATSFVVAPPPAEALPMRAGIVTEGPRPS